MVVFGRQVFVEYINKSREAEILTNISAVATAEEAYFQEFKSYSADPKAIGYSPEGNLRGALYFTYEEVPAEIQKLLGEEEKPFVSQDKYRILGVFKDGKTEVILFVKENGQPIKRIESPLPQTR